MKAWLYAIRLRTLPLAGAAIILGSASAWQQQVFQWPVMLLSLLTALLLQVLSNLANDYGDAQHGLDNEQRVGPSRAIQAGLLSPHQMLWGIKICTAFTLISGLSLLWLSLGNQWQLWACFLGFGLAAIVAAMAYTMGKQPYGYHGLGDISVFVFFGLLGVIGSYFLHDLSGFSPLWWAAIANGLLATAVLNINNLRDLIPDQQAGKRTLAVRLGAKRARCYHYLLLGLALLCLLIFIVNVAPRSFAWLMLAPASLLIQLSYRQLASDEPATLDKLLQRTAKLAFIIALLVSIGSNLSW